MGDKMKQIHTSKAATVIAQALQVITPNDAGALWAAVQSSHSVDIALGTSSAVEGKYLTASAETYANASSWDTQRQVLATMADLAPLSTLRNYIPNLSEWRFKMARLHILKYGRGSAMPIRQTPRMRIDENQLDHFLSFITSPHIIQDLPFGKRLLKLSDGSFLETPNVIRTMTSSRIIEQYTKFCEESGLLPLKERTVRRLLCACPATVRKSLQGLDYISADGAKAFEDLIEITRKTELNGGGNQWALTCEKALRQGKQYLKTEYKVRCPDTHAWMR